MLSRWSVQEPEWVRGTVEVDRTDDFVSVSVSDPRLAQREEGGVRVPGSVQSSLVRPVSADARAAGAVRGANTPRRVLLEGGFLAKLPDGRIGVFRVLSRRPRRTQLVFVVEPHVRVAADLKLEETVARTVARDLPAAVGRALSDATDGLNLVEPIRGRPSEGL